MKKLLSLGIVLLFLGMSAMPHTSQYKALVIPSILSA